MPRVASQVKPHYLLASVVIACAPRASSGPTTNRAAPERVDPIACPEARLRGLAAHFPAATLEIKIEEKLSESRGIVELSCPLLEGDNECLARARRQIPAGFVEIVFANGAGYLTGGAEWELALEIDGRLETKRFPLPELPQIIEEMYKAMGHRAKVISQRRIPTPEKREAVVWYGYQRRHREATLVFPSMERDLDIERIDALERQLHLYNDGNYGEYRDGSNVQWYVRFSCE